MLSSPRFLMFCSGIYLMKLLDTYSENRTGWAVVYTFAFIITFILGLENEKPID